MFQRRVLQFAIAVWINPQLQDTDIGQVSGILLDLSHRSARAELKLLPHDFLELFVLSGRPKQGEFLFSFLVLFYKRQADTVYRLRFVKEHSNGLRSGIAGTPSSSVCSECILNGMHGLLGTDFHLGDLPEIEPLKTRRKVYAVDFADEPLTHGDGGI
jgi:hypothetical protein